MAEGAGMSDKPAAPVGQGLQQEWKLNSVDVAIERTSERRNER